MSGAHAAYAVVTDGDTCTVSVSGEVDVSNAVELSAVLRNAMTDAGCATLVIDLTDLGFIDSTGIRSLVEVYQLSIIHHVMIRAVNPQSLVRQVMEIVGVSPLFNL